MRRILTIHATFLALTIAFPSAASANFIEAWNLAVVFNPGNAANESVRFTNVVSPFLDSHAIDLVDSLGMASYEFSWGPTGGMFDVNTTLAVTALPGIDRRLTAGGFIYINSPVPLLVSGSTQLEYDLTTHPTFASASIGIAQFDPPQDLAGGLDSYSTTINGPQSSTINVTFNEILIPPNEQFFLKYSFVIDTDDEVLLAATASGVGMAHFDITAVPEPTTALLIVLGGIPWILARGRGVRN